MFNNKKKEKKMSKNNNRKRVVKFYGGIGMGFDFDGFIITDCTLDPTGRFEVNPSTYYGLNKSQINKMEGADNE
tara:strand:- start:684 stop:905 length:222 start_codon:yes stop_codon:yes gene_type:complete